MSTEAEKDEIEETCRAHMEKTMLAAFAKEAQYGLPVYPSHLFPVVNAGALCGLADVLILAIIKTSLDPDSVAKAVAERIQTQVAAKTSGGRS